MSYIELHPNQVINVESVGRNLFKPTLSKYRGQGGNENEQ